MIKGTPSRDTVVKILDHLSGDNDFREHFLGDPVSALKAHGIEVDPDQVPAVRSLPSKDEILRIREKAAQVENPIEECGLWVFLLK